MAEKWESPQELRNPAYKASRSHFPRGQTADRRRAHSKNPLPPRPPTMPVLRSPFAGGDLPAGDADPDYLYFLEHIRLDGDSYTLELPARGDSPPSLLKYEAPLAGSSDGECVSDPSPGRLSSNRRAVEERESSQSASLETVPAWYDSLDDVDEDYRLFLQHTRLVDGQLVLEIGGVVVNYDEPVPPGSRGEKDTQRVEEPAFASPGEGVGVAAGSDEVASGALATVVPVQYACDWRADPSPRREVNDGGDEEGLSDANTLKGACREASSSDGCRAGHPANSVRNLILTIVCRCQFITSACCP